MQEKLLIKLGSKCNLNCSHCHCEQSSYTYNPDIIKWIKEFNPKRITFGGGEPTIYFKQIKKLVFLLGNSFSYRLVTNGTILTDDMCNFFNKNNFIICYSFDGSNSKRDLSKPIKWDKISKINNSFPISCYNKEQNFEKTTLDLVQIRNKFNGTFNIPYFISGSFIHTLNKNSYASLEDVNNFLKDIQKCLDELFNFYLQGYSIFCCELLLHSLTKWWFPKKETLGCACFNPKSINLTLDGKFLLCPYKTDTIGDIYSGIQWNQIKLPNKCLICPIRHICRNTCIANITENECIIAKEMYKYFDTKLSKLNIKDKVIKDLQKYYY